MRRLVGLVAALAAAAACGSAAHAAGPLRTAVVEPALASGDGAATEFQRIRDAGATAVRIEVAWSKVAPARRDGSFDAADPQSSGYDWTTLDDEVTQAVSSGLQPFLDVISAPAWAKVAGNGASHPATKDLAAFGTALARRYDGSSPDLPRVTTFQLWNEPNLNTNLTPQIAGSKPVSPAIYRGMANAFATAIKGVSPSNVVVVGALAPFGIQSKGESLGSVLSVAPLTFMRDLLCVSAGKRPHRTCGAKVRFDVFSVHPYTWGGPTHTAYSPDDVSIGDLPEVRQVLRAAWKLGRIQAPRAPQLWVTEFSWDTNPPDPKALPISIQARWTSEALYRMWADGVSLITWFLLRDQPIAQSPFQSGLYFAGSTLAGDRPKPTLTAFRFPFVALPKARGTLVWGRTPDSTPGSVRIERRVGSRWRLLAVVKANGSGIFQRVLPLAARRGALRARIGSDASLPFGLAPVPDRRISPFGS